MYRLKIKNKKNREENKVDITFELSLHKNLKDKNLDTHFKIKILIGRRYNCREKENRKHRVLFLKLKNKLEIKKKMKTFLIIF
jgi:hypothetical protein